MFKMILNYLGLFFVSLLVGNAHAGSEYLNELIATGMDGDILITVKGYGRTKDGLLDEIELDFTNTSKTNGYELLLDDRIVHQYWIMIIGDGRPLNDPLEGIEQPPLVDVSFNLVKLDPEKTIPFIIKIESAANIESAVYSTYETVDLNLHIDLPVYNAGSDTDRDARIGMIRVRSLLESVPVIASSELPSEVP